MALELEIKLTAPDYATLDAVLQDPAIAALAAPPVRVDYRATYYDTAAHILLHNHLAFRSRPEGDGRWRAAVKGFGGVVNGVSRREEWEGFLPHNPQNLEDFPPGEMREALDHLRVQAPQAVLQPLMVTDFERRAVHLTFPCGTEAEMALDRGQVEAGGKEQGLCEVELELLQGELAPIEALAETLKARHPLVPSPHSKFAIGLILLGMLER
ncbi:CYTH domain-containing protein [Magnetococcus sp. PR-3]|uniref:CYTH domain-containing protein n=1 Tax=Magnetococcus sp. PR-3 TaxID=3120355 RepID=UPI002FCE0800